MGFTERMASLVEDWWDAEGATEGLDHRPLMRLIATAVALEVVGHGSPERLERSLELTEQLAALQDPDGLFTADGNLHSPPDSSFTFNDVGIALELLPRVPGERAATLRQRLRQIAAAAPPALASGGVHTPNHRWEISAALMRLQELDEHLLERVEQWLAEGIDVDADGLYSERSANYAAFVSNPCLLALGEALDRPDLIEIVHRNLHAELDLTDADGTVETIFSRRQDQGGQIPLPAFHVQLRRFALEGCDVCAAGAARSEPQDGRLAAVALLELATHPNLGAELPAVKAPEPATRHFENVGLLVLRRGTERAVLYGGSDVPHVGRVGSGLAGNPTFMKYRSGAAVVRSLRLSRVFFGLGPFRAESLVMDDGDARLHESVAARYYHPLEKAALRADGVYPLADDGRFSAAMAFDERTGDDVRLTTDITVKQLDSGVQATFDITGARTTFALELALGDGDVSGVVQEAADTYRMSGQRAELRNGSDAVVIKTSLDPHAGGPGFYAPGEAFTFLNGTDALGGPRLYLTGTTPQRWTLTLRPI